MRHLAPHVIDPEAHAHPLNLTVDATLKLKDQGLVFICDGCNTTVDPVHWAYYCEDCDFGTHLDCGTSEACP